MRHLSELLAATDPVEFARERLGFEPDEAQKAVLRSDARRLILNCTRQWGKSTGGEGGTPGVDGGGVHRAGDVAERAAKRGAGAQGSGVRVDAGGEGAGGRVE